MLERVARFFGGEESRLRLLPCPGGWQEAASVARSHWREDPLPHFERVRIATSAVRDGRAPGTRDSVILPTPEFQYPVLAGILRSAVAHPRLRVLDFGGSLGSSYFQFRAFAPLVDVSWHIVELPELVAIGKAEFESPQLAFHRTLEEALDTAPHVALFSAALQFVEDAHSLLDRVTASECESLILDRVPLTDRAQDIAAAHIVTGSRFASDRCFPSWLFSETKLLECLERNWTVVARFASLDSPERAGDVAVTFKGLLLERHRPAPR